MRVLQIISEAPPVKSGFARCMQYLSTWLGRMGCEVDVLSAKDLRHILAGEVKLVLDAGRISRSMISNEYDVINIHGHTPTFSDVAFMLGKLMRRPLVYTLHCLVNFYFHPFSKIYNILMNNFLKFSDAVIVSSKSYLQYVRTCKNKFVIPWAVDNELFQGESIKHDAYRVLFVGQMRPYKGLGILLQAAKGLDAEFHIVGDGPDFRSYEDQAKKLELNKVKFHRGVGDAELNNFYLGSDVLVLPSVSENEAFGLVTLEAAASGCAVVASNLPGVRDVVKDFGLLVKPNDVKDLRQALEQLREKSAREVYQQKGRKVAKEYRWENVARGYLEAYKSIA